MDKGQRRMQVARKFFPHSKMGARRAYHALFFLSRSRLVCLAGMCSSALARCLLFFSLSGRQRGRPG